MNKIQYKSSINIQNTQLTRILGDCIKRNVVFTITGGSGVGKDVIINEILRTNSNFIKPISFTTRDKRPGEIDGVDYYFITNEEFNKMLKNGEIFEHTTVKGNFYGYTNSELERIFKTGKNPICIVDEVGVEEITKGVGDKLNIFKIFVMPPTAQELHRRLKNREIRNALHISDQEVQIPEDIRKDAFKKARSIIRKAFIESAPWIKRAINKEVEYDCIITNGGLKEAIEITKQLLDNVLSGNLKINK